MRDNEEVYKSVYGSEWYNTIMVGLLDIMVGGKESMVEQTIESNN